MPTTDLDIDRISSLCHPVFEDIHSRSPSFRWAGVFGSVSRGTQRPDSDVDIIVGYSPDADGFHDVCGGIGSLVKRLPETLGVEVDVIAFVEQGIFRYVDMEAMLTAKTIWGDVSWPEASRDTAVELLQQGYARMTKAKEIMSHVRRTLLTIEADPMSPEHEALRVSLLQEALSVIHLVKIPGDPFYPNLKSVMRDMLAKEKTIQAYLRGDVDLQALEGIWSVLSDLKNTASLFGMKQAAVQTFHRAGLVLPE